MVGAYCDGKRFLFTVLVHATLITAQPVQVVVHDNYDDKQVETTHHGKERQGSAFYRIAGLTGRGFLR